MSNDEERVPLSFAEVYRLARAAGARAVPAFDLQRGLDEMRAWIDREVDLVEEAGQDHTPAGAPGSQPELRGRDDLLEQLVALARRPDGRPAVLVGTGGAGKSTLAAALAEQARSWGRLVWWVSAADLAGLSAGLAAVVRDLGGSVTDVESIAKGAADGPDRLWHLLEGSPHRWLLVIDNADDPWTLAAGDSPAGVQDGSGWARPSKRGLVVVTSRETDERLWSGARLLRVGHLATADAAQVLRDLAPDAGDETAARALARTLGGLPLTLQLAGKYLRSGVAEWPTFAAYDHAVGSLQGGMVARAAEISLDGLARHGVPQARDLMRLASCYGPTSIPTGILPAAGLGAALEGLSGVGLIEGSRRSIALHPAVTEANRARLDGPEVWHSAITHLTGALGELSFARPEHWPRYRLFAQHLLAMLGAAAQVDREHLALLMTAAATTARALIHSGEGRAAGMLCRKALEHGAALGGEHRAVLRVRHQLAWTVADAGDLSRAEDIYRDVLDIRRRVLGDSDPDTLDSRHELAWIAGCLDRWPEAEQGYRDTLRDRLDQEAPDTRDSLTTRHELAYAIARQGRLGEARQAFEDVLRDRRRVLSDRAPQTLQTQHAIAWITAKQGNWAEAEGRYRELLDLREALGADHPHVLLTLHELAWTLARQGRRSEAESLYRRVLEHRSRTLGEDHPETETTRLALRELRRGRIVDAVHPA